MTDRPDEDFAVLTATGAAMREAYVKHRDLSVSRDDMLLFDAALSRIRSRMEELQGKDYHWAFIDEQERANKAEAERDALRARIEELERVVEAFEQAYVRDNDRIEELEGALRGTDKALGVIYENTEDKAVYALHRFVDAALEGDKG